MCTKIPKKVLISSGNMLKLQPESCTMWWLVKTDRYWISCSSILSAAVGSSLYGPTVLTSTTQYIYKWAVFHMKINKLSSANLLKYPWDNYLLETNQNMTFKLILIMNIMLTFPFSIKCACLHGSYFEKTGMGKLAKSHPPHTMSYFKAPVVHFNEQQDLIEWHVVWESWAKT